jgi:hypothetical protein
MLCMVCPRRRSIPNWQEPQQASFLAADAPNNYMYE